jgi:hypothetical protein
VVTLPPPFEEPPPDDPERLKMALKIASENIAELSTQRAQVLAALSRALLLLDLMVTELRNLPRVPVQLILAHEDFAKAMKALLQEDQ